ncbi:DUF1735 domain-containing protein [Pedobacter sp. 22226]|uniref:DUF1735 domain-containing protein n=1 Tax=Pedobacter sp. 22226 TaxID=3453894 RepID=UPI003F879A80
MKNKNIFSGLAAMLCIVSLSSCLKNKNEQPDFSATTPVVEIPVGSPVGDGSVNSLTTSLIQQDAPSDYIYYINYAASSTKSTDIKVTLSIDPATLDKYNAAHTDAPLTMVPTNAFSTSTTITIPANTRRVQVPVKFVSTALDPALSYGLPIKITDASGEVISKNFGAVVIKVAVRNRYDGKYSLKGYIFREGDTDGLMGYFKGLSQDLSSNGATALNFSQVWKTGAGAGGIDGLTINVNPTTNKVTMKSTANATLVNDPAYDSRYDPATKTFYISFKWGASPASRAATDTLTYVSAR